MSPFLSNALIWSILILALVGGGRVIEEDVSSLNSSRSRLQQLRQLELEHRALLHPLLELNENDQHQPPQLQGLISNQAYRVSVGSALPLVDGWERIEAKVTVEALEWPEIVRLLDEAASGSPGWQLQGLDLRPAGTGLKGELQLSAVQKPAVESPSF